MTSNSGALNVSPTIQPVGLVPLMHIKADGFSGITGPSGKGLVRLRCTRPFPEGVLGPKENRRYVK